MGEGFRFFRKRFRFSLPSSLENEMGEGFGRFFALRENPFKREFENDMRTSSAFARFRAFAHVSFLAICRKFCFFFFSFRFA